MAIKMRLNRKKSQSSAGYLPSIVRKETLKLCKDIVKHKGSNLLEVGCGEGLFLTKLAKDFPYLNIIGIDRSKQIIDKLQIETEEMKSNNIDLICAKADNLPFRDDFFDTVVCINTIYNLPPKDLPGIFKEISRISKPKANFIFDIRNKLNFLLFLGYKLAKYYDSSCPRYLISYRVKKILEILKKLDFHIFKRIAIGFPLKLVAPVIMIKAEKHSPNSQLE